ncbi:hypothetical protein [Sutcliffiella deserti]|uniref:hypothetical protein n=1 Tax=Sutcliffiella deserti TaxID=2875501 RepID=UPI001CBFDE3E|nr:hypothetical protein [Sutcliffiella deserti]
MKKETKNIIIGSMLSAAGSAVLVKEVIKKRQKNKYRVLEDTDMRNSKKIDRMESVDASKDEKEKGLTQLDSAYRAEWVANGFPQTHKKMKELEEEEKKNNIGDKSGN